MNAKIILDKMQVALKQFGEYTFCDKGPQEVMSLREITDELEKMKADEVGAILKEVKNHSDHGRILANALIDSLDHVLDDEWFDKVINISGVEY